MSREGDWNCSSCQHMNFKRRDSCQVCGCPKFASADDISSYGAQRQVMPGDWYCNVVFCGAHNYASRASCYQCGSFKDDYGGSTMGSNTLVSAGCSLPGWKTGDWVCSSVGCGAHNYACRTGCYKCSTPKGG